MNIADKIITVSIILILFFLTLTVLFFRKAKKIKSGVVVKKEEGSEADFKKFKENWQAVLYHLNSNNESDWKLAVIEADKLVDDLLVQKGYKGESLAERLSFVNKKELKSLGLLWEAHKIRNRITHQSGFKLDYNQASKAISYYEEALKDLRGL